MKMYHVEVFVNEGDEITIRQENARDDDSLIVITAEQAKYVADSLMALAAEINTYKTEEQGQGNGEN